MSAAVQNVTQRTKATALFDSGTIQRYKGLLEFAEGLGTTEYMIFPQNNGVGSIIAKCEWGNPTGSIKDRTAFALVYDLLTRNDNVTHIIEYTGGNLGVSLSRICQLIEMPNTLVMADFVPPDVIAMLTNQGSSIELVPKEHGFWHVMKRAFELAEANPTWSFLYQHVNRSNVWVHEHSTGQEFVAALHELSVGRVDAWVASIGTGGTLQGVYKALKCIAPQIQLYGVTPSELPYASRDKPNGLAKYAGSGGLGDGRRQLFVEECEADLAGQYVVSFADSLKCIAKIYEMTGLRVGSSAAANYLAASEVAKRLGSESVVATVFPSAATEREWDVASRATYAERRSACAYPYPYGGRQNNVDT